MRTPSRLACFVVVAGAALVAPAPASATDYYVNRLSDSAGGDCSGDPGDCSLRAAILNANAHPGADNIYLFTGTFELTLPGYDEDEGLTGDLDVTDSVTVFGRGPERTIVDANSIDRVFDVHAPGETLVLRGLTVTGGVVIQNGNGGGIRLEDGSLSLQACFVTGNTANEGFAGAVYAVTPNGSGIVSIIDSWITGNTSESSSVWIVPRLWLLHSTVSGNTSTVGGAPLVVAGDMSLLWECTVSGNTTPSFSAGVLFYGLDNDIDGCTLAHDSEGVLHLLDTATVTLRNTAILGFCTGMVQPTSSGGNLESPGHLCGLGANDLEDVADPGLSALGFFGGPTPVHQPQAGSPALDAAIADPGCSELDQRRLARPRDGDGAGGAACDIGAVELAGPGEIFLDGFECGFFTAWSAASI